MDAAFRTRHAILVGRGQACAAQAARAYRALCFRYYRDRGGRLDPAALHIGMPVEVRFADLGYPALETGIVAPLFAP
jgi:hypothetical protein